MNHGGLDARLSSLFRCCSQNWSFGFERIVELRLKPVNIASRELSDAEADLSALENQHNQITKSSAQKRDELRQQAERQDASIADLTAQLSKEADTHQKNLEEIREACRIIREKCMDSRSQAEDERYKSEISRLSAAPASLREERKQLLSQIDALVTLDAGKAGELDSKIAAATVVANEKRQAFQRATEGNQIYRLAASWYGVNTSAVTAEQFATALSRPSVPSPSLWLAASVPSFITHPAAQLAFARVARQRPVGTGSRPAISRVEENGTSPYGMKIGCRGSGTRARASRVGNLQQTHSPKRRSNKLPAKAL